MKDCWEWIGPLDRYGYGKAKVEGRWVGAHRLAYEEAIGPIPTGLQVDHICHNESECEGGRQCPHRRCVNPEHLRLTSCRENVLAGNTIAAKRKRQTHCVNGHPFDYENTYWHQGCRQCRECARERVRQYRARKAQLEVAT